MPFGSARTLPHFVTERRDDGRGWVMRMINYVTSKPLKAATHFERATGSVWLTDGAGKRKAINNGLLRSRKVAPLLDEVAQTLGERWCEAMVGPTIDATVLALAELYPEDADCLAAAQLDDVLTGNKFKPPPLPWMEPRHRLNTPSLQRRLAEQSTEIERAVLLCNYVVLAPLFTGTFMAHLLEHHIEWLKLPEGGNSQRKANAESLIALIRLWEGDESASAFRAATPQASKLVVAKVAAAARDGNHGPALRYDRYQIPSRAKPTPASSPLVEGLHLLFRVSPHAMLKASRCGTFEAFKAALHQSGKIKHICGNLYNAKQRTELLALGRINVDSDTPCGPGSRKTWQQIFEVEGITPPGQTVSQSHIAQAAQCAAKAWPGYVDREVQRRKAADRSMPAQAEQSDGKQRPAIRLEALINRLIARFEGGLRQLLERVLARVEVEGVSCEVRRGLNCYRATRGEVNEETQKKIKARCARRGKSRRSDISTGERIPPLHRAGGISVPRVAETGCGLSMSPVERSSLRPCVRK